METVLEESTSLNFRADPVLSAAVDVRRMAGGPLRVPATTSTRWRAPDWPKAFDDRPGRAARSAARTEATPRRVRRSARSALRQPLWLEYTAGLFPVIAVVFFLRSFLVEPFKIPSGSMIPTLLVGDLILVNKFSYGVRLPVVHTKTVRRRPARSVVT
jgi:signal peptidase I